MRKNANQSADALAMAFSGIGMSQPEGIGFAFSMPPIMGMSTTGGFEGYIQIDCTFRKSEVVYKKEKVNTSKNAKFVFPNAKMGE